MDRPGCRGKPEGETGQAGRGRQGLRTTGRNGGWNGWNGNGKPGKDWTPHEGPSRWPGGQRRTVKAEGSRNRNGRLDGRSGGTGNRAAQAARRKEPIGSLQQGTHPPRRTGSGLRTEEREAASRKTKVARPQKEGNAAGKRVAKPQGREWLK